MQGIGLRQRGAEHRERNKTDQDEHADAEQFAHPFSVEDALNTLLIFRFTAL